MAVRDGLALTEDQRALRDTLRGFLADQVPPAALRAMLDTDAGYRPELHARLAAELGLAGLRIPEEFGGLGLSPSDACVVHAELGRALYPGPFLPGCLAAAALLAADSGTADSGTAAERWLPGLADGSVTGAAAVADEQGRWSPGGAGVRAEPVAGAREAAGSWRLHGVRWHVIGGHVADILVVPATAGTGTALFLVESRAAGVTRAVQPGLDLTRKVCVTTFEAAPAVLLSRGETATAALDRVHREFLLATAAEAAGGIGWCLEAAVAYAKDREQFGRPIGAFQAVAHTCVDMLAEATAASSVARYAAAADAQGDAEAPLAARVAALRAGQAYRAVTEAAIHLFGGMGFTWEHDAHLYYRRAWSAERLSGGPHAHRAAVADLAGL